MSTSLSQSIYLILLGAVYLPIIFYAIQGKEVGYGAATWLVVLYSMLALVIDVVEAVSLNNDNAAGFHEVQTYTAITLAAILMITFQTFLKRENWVGWVGFWLVWTLSLGLIVANALNLPDILWTNGTVALFRSRLGPAWAVLGWLILIIGLILAVAGESRITPQQHLRNRLNYWWPAIFFMVANDILFFSDVNFLGQPLRLGTAFTATYVVITHQVPDLRQVMRRVLTYLTIVLTVVFFYVAGFLVVQAMFSGVENFSPLATGAGISLIIAIVFTPLSSYITRTINRWMKGDVYDTNLTIHKYSKNISSILDIDRLASIAVSNILESMHIEKGFLFLIDSERQADGRLLYKIRSARTPEERKKVLIELDENGSIASYFLREQRPLLQYDLDFLPAFRGAKRYERDWLAKLQTEVYIPVFASRKWIGLFAFGSKTNGNRFTQDDLKVLSAHAGQTAVALENARLVDNLMVLNTELRQARRQLEKNNQDLERIDRAKSDFISIASHELRTPLTVIKGYTEMMIDNPNLNDNLQKMMKGIYDGTLRLYEVMESMFDIAQIDTRTLQPHIQSVELGLLIKDICDEQAKAFEERSQIIELNISALPHIKADPNLMKKVFHHLICNAIKFTPDYGKITISGNHLPSIVSLPEGGVEIIVTDTGVGVDPDLRDVIFTKFYQPGELGRHSTSKTRFKGGGAGLGLALSKGIIEAHGGRIWVESEGFDEENFPGSQFHIVIPLTQPEPGQIPRTSDPIKTGPIAAKSEMQSHKDMADSVN